MTRRRWELLALLAIVMTGMGLRFWRLDGLALVGDESYFWLWSRHLAACYMDHPGGVAWLIAVSTWLGGGSEFGVRWLNALLGTANIVLVYGLARRLAAPVGPAPAGAGGAAAVMPVRGLAGPDLRAKGLKPRTGTAGPGRGIWPPGMSGQAPVALAAAMILAVAPPYVLNSRFVYTDTLPTFLLLASFNLLWPALTSPTARPAPIRRWLAIGILWLLLVNTKISVYPAFLGLAIGGLLWRRDLRHQPGVWLAGGLAALGLLPLLVWNGTHDWIGLRWIWQQFTLGTIRESGFLSTAHHVVAYFTLPAIVLIAPGYLPGWREPARRGAGWLLLPSLLMVLPVLLSPANSPRNLLVGLALAIPLAAAWWVNLAAWHPLASGLARMGGWRPPTFAIVTLAALVCGVGTVAALLGESPLASSSVAYAVREDAAGWRELGPRLSSAQGMLFTVDYSVASQLTYYAGRPVYTAWPQYLLWGLPEFDEVQVLSLSYVPPDRVDAVLRRAFDEVRGPQLETLRENGAAKEMRSWRAVGLRVERGDLVEALDFFALGRSRPGELPARLAVPASRSEE